MENHFGSIVKLHVHSGPPILTMDGILHFFGMVSAAIENGSTFRCHGQMLRNREEREMLALGVTGEMHMLVGRVDRLKLRVPILIENHFVGEIAHRFVQRTPCLSFIRCVFLVVQGGAGEGLLVEIRNRPVEILVCQPALDELVYGLVELRIRIAEPRLEHVEFVVIAQVRNLGMISMFSITLDSHNFPVAILLRPIAGRLAHRGLRRS